MRELGDGGDGRVGGGSLVDKGDVCIRARRLSNVETKKDTVMLAGVQVGCLLEVSKWYLSLIGLLWIFIAGLHVPHHRLHTRCIRVHAAYLYYTCILYVYKSTCKRAQSTLVGCITISCTHRHCK